MQYNHYTEPGQDFVIGNTNRLFPIFSISLNFLLVLGDEDCLYLNVYTPDTNSTTLLDVVIFIHGGAFMFNYGGSYGPKILLDRSTNVFVTMNYRLGPLGIHFLEKIYIHH